MMQFKNIQNDIYQEEMRVYIYSSMSFMLL